MRSLRTSLTSLSLQSISILVLLNPQVTEAGCFHPNGTQTTDLYHAPCSNDSSNPLSTICCAVERANPAQGLSADGFTRDLCLDNGICQNSWRANRNDPQVTISYYREECTVQDWRSGKCLDVCVGEINRGNALMTPCGGDPKSEQWCCGNSDSCCDRTGVVQVPSLFQHAVNTSSTLPPSSSATAQSASNAASQSSTNAPAQSSANGAATTSGGSSLGGGAIAGIILGVVAGILLFLVAGFLIMKKRRKSVAGPTLHGFDQKVYYAHEVDSEPEPVEAPTEVRRHELA